MGSQDLGVRSVFGPCAASPGPPDQPRGSCCRTRMAGGQIPVNLILSASFCTPIGLSFPRRIYLYYIMPPIEPRG
jgi:hypothetical protein